MVCLIRQERTAIDSTLKSAVTARTNYFKSHLPVEAEASSSAQAMSVLMFREAVDGARIFYYV